MLPTDHPLWSYRLAKFEVAAEKRGVGRESFAKFERDISVKLRALGGSLARADEIFRGIDVGAVWVRPKSVESVHEHSDYGSIVRVPEPAHDHRLSAVNVRVMLEPSPEFATCEVAWLRAFGPMFQNFLSQSCRGNRLDVRGSPSRVPAGGRQVFRYWPPEYRSFRASAMKAARDCLTEHGRCVLTTLDLASFYDNIDPSFLLSRRFVARLSLPALLAGASFDHAEYMAATTGLLHAYERFRSQVAQVVGIRRTRGIPIGSLSARLVANLALKELDDQIAGLREVQHYARYVDDILVVERPQSPEPTTARQVIERLLPLDDALTDESRYVLDSKRLGRPGSEFVIQTQKLRVFDLRGDQGTEYLHAVEAEMQRVSSERRRFLEPSEEVERTLAASSDGEPIQALREADVLSIRRFAASTVAGKVITAAAMLSRAEARRFSRAHLRDAAHAATEWSRWIDLIDVAIRMLGATLMAGDGETANEIVEALLERCSSLADGYAQPIPIRWNGSEVNHSTTVRLLRDWVEEQISEAISASAPFNNDVFLVDGLSVLEAGNSALSARFRAGALLRRAKLLASADLRAVDRETDQAIGVSATPLRRRGVQAVQRELQTDAAYGPRISSLREFLKVCRQASDKVYGNLSPAELLLLTKPPSFVDVLLRWLRARRGYGGLIQVVNAVRGTQYAELPVREDPNGLVWLSAEEASEMSRTRVVLANLLTKDTWWDESLSLDFAPCRTGLGHEKSC